MIHAFAESCNLESHTRLILLFTYLLAFVHLTLEHRNGALTAVSGEIV